MFQIDEIFFGSYARNLGKKCHFVQFLSDFSFSQPGSTIEPALIIAGVRQQQGVTINA